MYGTITLIANEMFPGRKEHTIVILYDSFKLSKKVIEISTYPALGAYLASAIPAKRSFASKIELGV